jgi:hypothetical protein
MAVVLLNDALRQQLDKLPRAIRQGGKYSRSSAWLVDPDNDRPGQP